MNGALKNKSVIHHWEPKSHIIQSQRKIRRDTINYARKYSKAFLWVLRLMQEKMDERNIVAHEKE